MFFPLLEAKKAIEVPSTALTVMLLTFLKRAVEAHMKLRQPGARAHGHSWLERYVAFMLFNFGGSILVGTLLGQGPKTFMNNFDIPVATAIWFALEWSPFGILGSVLSVSWVRMVLVAANCVSDALALTAGVDLALSAQHASLRTFPMAFLCGCLSFTGGGLLTQLFGTLGEWKFGRSDTLRSPPLSVYVGYYCAFAYALLRCFAVVDDATVSLDTLARVAIGVAAPGFLNASDALPCSLPALLNLARAVATRFTPEGMPYLKALLASADVAATMATLHDETGTAAAVGPQLVVANVDVRAAVLLVFVPLAVLTNIINGAMFNTVPAAAKPAIAAGTAITAVPAAAAPAKPVAAVQQKPAPKSPSSPSAAAAASASAASASAASNSNSTPASPSKSSGKAAASPQKSPANEGLRKRNA